MTRQDTYLKIARSYFKRGIDAVHADHKLIGKTLHLFDEPFVVDESDILNKYVKYLQICQRIGIFPVFCVQAALWAEQLEEYKDFAKRLQQTLKKTRPADYKAFFIDITDKSYGLLFDEHVKELCFSRAKGAPLTDSLIIHAIGQSLYSTGPVPFPSCKTVFYASIARCMTPSFQSYVWPSLKKHPLKLTENVDIHLDSKKIARAWGRLIAITKTVDITSLDDKRYQVFVAQWVLSLATWFGVDPKLLVTTIGFDKNDVDYDWTGIDIQFDDDLGFKNEPVQKKGTINTYQFLQMLIALAAEAINRAGNQIDNFISPWDMRLDVYSGNLINLDELKKMIYSLDFIPEPDKPFKVSMGLIDVRHGQCKNFVTNVLDYFYPSSEFWGEVDENFVKNVVKREILGRFMNVRNYPDANDLALKIALVGRYLLVCKNSGYAPLLMLAADAETVDNL